MHECGLKSFLTSLHRIERVQQIFGRKNAGVEKAVIVPDAVTEGDEVVEHRSEIRDQHRRRAPLEQLSVHRQLHVKFLQTKHSPISADHVSEKPETLLEPRRRQRDHRRVESDTETERESPAVRQPPEIDSRGVARKEAGPPASDRGECEAFLPRC